MGGWRVEGLLEDDLGRKAQRGRSREEDQSREDQGWGITGKQRRQRGPSNPVFPPQEGHTGKGGRPSSPRATHEPEQELTCAEAWTPEDLRPHPTPPTISTHQGPPPP